MGTRPGIHPLSLGTRRGLVTPVSFLSTTTVGTGSAVGPGSVSGPRGRGPTLIYLSLREVLVVLLLGVSKVLDPFP